MEEKQKDKELKKRFCKCCNLMTHTRKGYIYLCDRCFKDRRGLKQIKDNKLRELIINLTEDSFMTKTEGLIDTFVERYDNDKWCRGNFKSQIGMLVFEALSKPKKKERD